MKNSTKLVGIGLLCTFLAGCGKNGEQRDAADEKNVYVRRGLEQIHLKNWDCAIEQLERAVAKNPKLARPDLELALIYHQQKDDYICAIYHYERYLKKRPVTEKHSLILNWIRQAKLSLAGEIGRVSGDISDELVRTKRENNLLRKQLDAFKRSASIPSIAKRKTTVNTSPQILKPIEKNQPIVPMSRTYKVLAGDTLSRIALNVYGDQNKWRKIYQANSEIMRNENDLKPGQILSIPVTKP